MRASFIGLLLLVACGGKPPSVCEGQCPTPPPSECVDGTTLRTFAAASSCTDGCQWVPSDRKCDRGCSDGLCTPPGAVGGGSGGAGGGGGSGGSGGGSGGGDGGDGGVDACAGVSCNAPPASACANSQSLKVYEAPGVCGAGQCQYASHLETCANGCANAKCIGNPCQGVSCNAPPASTCLDANTLTSYATAGTCAGGACSYAPSSTTCPFGCANDQCTGDPCLGKSCNQPPAAFCATASTRRSFAPAGTCAGGGCTYASSDTSCSFGCANGQCNADPCSGVSCTTPPATFCSSATALRTFPTAGTCAAGSCSYAPSDQTCPFGCGNAACLPNPCASITCNAPPAATCVGTSVRTWSPTGTCAMGACSYTSVDSPCANGCAGGQCLAPVCNGVACNAAPAAACVSSQRLRTYARIGSCVSNACSYQTIDIDCSQGCFSGACIAGSWTLEIPATTATLSQPSIAFDAASTPHIAGCSAINDLIYRSRTDTGWFDEVVDPGLGAGCYASIGVDPSGTVAIAYHDAVNKDLRFARRVNGTWQKELAVTAGDVGRGAGLTFDSSGQAVVGFLDKTTSELRLARRTAASTWTNELVLAAVSYFYTPATSVRIDAQGATHVVVGPLGAPSYVNGAVYYARKPAAGTWQSETLASAGYGSVARSAIGLTPSGDLRLLWSLGNTLHLRSLEAAGQFTERMLSNGYVGFGGNLDATAKPVLLQAGVTPPAMTSGMVEPLNGFWEKRPLPLASGLVFVHDAKRAPNGRLNVLGNSALLASPVQCVPACSGRTCGDDACGGSCGSCSATQACDPKGTCGGWAGETLRGVAQNVDTANAALAISPAGTVHAMLGVGTPQYFPHRYFRRDAAGWTAPELVSSTIVSSDESFVLSNAGVPLLAYENTEYGVRERSSAAWPASAASTEWGTAANLHIDASGAKKLVRAKLTGSPQTWELQVLTQNGAAAWTSASAVSGTGYADRISSGIDGQGKIHALFVESLNGTSAVKLKYASNASGAWVVEQVDTQSSSYTQVQLVVSAAGVPHVVYFPYGQGHYAVRGAGGWVKEALPASVVIDGWSSLARLQLDPVGVPTLAMTKQVLAGTARALIYAQRTGSGAWSTQTISTFGISTSHPSNPDLRFDAAGKPHLLLWDDQVLRHVYKP